MLRFNHGLRKWVASWRAAAGRRVMEHLSSEAAGPQGHARAAATDANPVSNPHVKGVVFDMDGTLTVPCIDFVEMRRVVGIMEGDILDVIAKMPPKQRETTHKALVDFELQALDKMRLMPGVEDVAQLLDERSVPRGLITRNVLESVHHFHSSVLNLSPFSPALARCFKPPKPAPDSLLHIASEWGVAPEQCMMVGDSPKDDIVCGNRARAVTVLIDVHGQYSCDELPEEQQPDFYVQSMEELQGVLTDQCQLG